MSSNRDIRRRIRSIKSTRQITKAMELVAAAKMRKAQLMAVNGRTYAALAWELITNLGQDIHPQAHRLLRQPEKAESVAVVLMTSNRGLIGGFNNNLVNAVFAATQPEQKLEFITFGKKGLTAVRKRGQLVTAEFEKKETVLSTLEIRPIAKLAVSKFMTGKYDKVVLAYMEFVSTLVQKPRVQTLLPFPARPEFLLTNDELEQSRPDEQELNSVYLFEPTPDDVLEVLLPRLVEMQIYRALLETNAAEHSARMVAMRNASEAANDLVSELTLEYNQLRQAGITKEISEIVGGQLVLTN